MLHMENGFLCSVKLKCGLSDSVGISLEVLPRKMLGSKNRCVNFV